MQSLNYQQLFYFWVVAREGGLTHAGRVLRLSHPTLHAHVRALEAHLGLALFEKRGRRLELTEEGRVVQRYADEIFSLGREMVDTVHHLTAGKVARLHVGVVEAMPKIVVRELLEPVLTLPEPVRIIVREAARDVLLAELALHRVDLVLADAPLPKGGAVRAFHHHLGSSEVGWFAVPALARALARGFPGSLHGAPTLLPVETLPVRRSLDGFFAAHRVVPKLVGEFSDSALLKVFGATGAGVFPAPIAVQEEVCAQYGVELVGLAQGVEQSFYAITLERRLASAPVLALWQAARASLFGEPRAKGRGGARRRRP
ncbi:MAG: LysR family transcriptional regulator [Sandaracinaceae bacterium]|nr:LysR family transcriptional regulator [Sandaracinaceae bacterium]